jgi:hypothetical protein
VKHQEERQSFLHTEREKREREEEREKQLDEDNSLYNKDK